MGHLAALKDAGDALNNGNLPVVNSITNWVRKNTGDGRITSFDTAADAVSNELERSFRGNSTAIAGIKSWRDIIGSSASPAQQQAAWKQMVTLLDSRIDALGDQYSRGMGRTTDGLSLLEPHAQEAYRHITGSSPDVPTFSQTGAKQEAPGSSPNPQPKAPTAPTAPIAPIAVGPNGQRITLAPDGQSWVPVP